MDATPTATLTVQRDGSDRFLVALEGFHYPGEGQLVDRSDLEALIGSGATEILIDQLDAEESGIKTERAA
jgi:predicted aspartyl protease